MNQAEGKTWWCNGWVLFGALSLFQAIWVFQGLDVTDSGLHLASQARSFPYGRDLADAGVHEPLWFLSDYVGGMWLALLAGPSLLWARLGGVLVQSLTALVSYKALSRLFGRRRVFVVVLACAAFLTSRSFATYINYYTFPALLATIELWILCGLVDAKPGGLPHRALAFSFGFLLLPLALARLPLVLFALVLPVLWVYSLVAGRGPAESKAAAPWVVAGVAASVALFAILYGSLGVLNGYVGAVGRFLSGSFRPDAEVMDRHNVWSVVWPLAIGYGKYLVVAGLGLAALHGLWFVRERWGSRVAVAVLLVLALVGSVLVARRGPIQLYASRATCAMVGAVLLVAVLFLLHFRGREEKLGIVLLASVFAMVIGPVGSANDLMMVGYGMWFALPLTILILDVLQRDLESPRLRWMCSLNNLALCLLVPLALVSCFTNVYRDCPDRLKLDTQFAYGPLRHIYSTRGKVAAVDAALVKIEELTKREDRVLMDNIPMFHYLTGRAPFLGTPWPRLESLGEIKRRVARATERGDYPALLVCRTMYGGPDEWPPDLVHADKTAYLKAHYVGAHGYTLVWENPFCQMYARPRGPAGGEGRGDANAR